MAFSMALPWSEGEEEMQRAMKIPPIDNPTSSMLTPQAAFSLQRVPLLAVGTVDAHGLPWATVWGGEPGFSQPLSNTIVGTKTFVDSQNDPVVQSLVGGRADGEVVKEEGAGRMVAALTIDLMTRKRVKIYGRMVAGALARAEESDQEDGGSVKPINQGLIQLVYNVEQSLGNCPKYLNNKEIQPAAIQSRLISDSPQLTPEALKLLNDMDLFFISSAAASDMDVNHRGGPVGFVRVLSNSADGAELVYPEYSGNRLYQTLGNLRRNPKAGLVFPHFTTGNVLYVTGTTEILIGDEAAKIIPHSNLAVKIKITAARFVERGLPFRGDPKQPSPYNPNVRLLASETTTSIPSPNINPTMATLTSKTTITPTITRYHFSTSHPITHHPGQWIALDFSSELSTGYSHMRDDDPRSLNDDFIRTFTISSTPPMEPGTPTSSFAITARTNGPVTTFLSRLNPHADFSVPIRGIGGDFRLPLPEKTQEIVPFVAGGVGITPLLGQVPAFPIRQLRLLWTVRVEDVGLVADTLASATDLVSQTTLFVTGGPLEDQKDADCEVWNALRGQGLKVLWRRMERADLDEVEAATWYFCAGVSLQRTLLEWLRDRKPVYESFNY